jgi:hypothetical protein
MFLLLLGGGSGVSFLWTGEARAIALIIGTPKMPEGTEIKADWI